MLNLILLNDLPGLIEVISINIDFSFKVGILKKHISKFTRFIIHLI